MSLQKIQEERKEKVGCSKRECLVLVSGGSVVILSFAVLSLFFIGTEEIKNNFLPIFFPLFLFVSIIHFVLFEPGGVFISKHRTI